MIWPRKRVKDVREPLQHAPKDTVLLNVAAWILATSPYKSLRDGNESVRLAELAWKLSGGNDPFSLATLAAAYAETGRFDDACHRRRPVRPRYLAEALPDNGKMDAQLSDWIAKFKNKKPIRDLRQQ